MADKKIIFPRPDPQDTPKSFAYGIVKTLWLTNHPGKTVADFEEQWRLDEEADKAKEENHPK